MIDAREDQATGLQHHGEEAGGDEEAGDARGDGRPPGVGAQPVKDGTDEEGGGR